MNSVTIPRCSLYTLCSFICQKSLFGLTNGLSFVQGKADIDAQNNKLQTSLHIAVVGQNLQMVQVSSLVC